MTPGTRAYIAVVMIIIMGFVLSWHLADAEAFLGSVAAGIAKLAHDAYRDRNGVPIPTEPEAG